MSEKPQYPPEYILEQFHLHAHSAEHDVEDTAVFAVTRLDSILLGMGLFIVGHTFPCLLNEIMDLDQRLAELISAQKGEDWKKAPPGQEEEEDDES